MGYRIVQVGVDVGGTNTDAVILCDRDILGWSKQVTTKDVTSGVVSAVSSALDCAVDSLKQGISGVRSTQGIKVERIHIGTTQFINAVIQQDNLVPVAVIRLCGPTSTVLPPFSDFPKELANIIAGPVFMVDGGYYFDGNKEISSLKKEQIEDCVEKIRNHGISNIVVSGIFSPVNDSQERQVGKWIKELFPKASITLSHKIVELGILIRENSAILNESLKPLGRRTIEALTEAFHRLRLRCPIYLTQNDGTLISAENVQEFPVLTFASGATNSMRGAAYLSGVKDGIVIDIGGTSTDAGLIQSGFPKQAQSKIKIGGVLTNFQMPDTLSIGLGGGSVVKVTDTLTSKISIGPESVGNKLRQESVIFGGKTLTTTDVAVAVGHCNLGNWEEDMTHWLTDVLAKAANDKTHERVEDVIDRLKTNPSAIPVILVGGGSILLNIDRHIQGSSKVIRPQHYQVANAVGAALSQVSAYIDTIENLTSVSRDDAVKITKNKATELVIEKGADPQTVEILDVMEVPLSYLPGNCTRLRVIAVGDIRTSGQFAVPWKGGQPVTISDTTTSNLGKQKRTNQTKAEVNPITPTDNTYVTKDNAPINIDPSTGEWLLSVDDIESLAIGAGILGCGGGGNPHYLKIWIQRELESGKKIRVINVNRYVRQSSEGDYSLAFGYMGAPTVSGEMLFCTKQHEASVRAIQHIVSMPGYTWNQSCEDIQGIGDVIKEEVSYVCDFNVDNNDATNTNHRLTALLSVEIGGFNSMTPFVLAAEMDLPILDCDLMGRAFPELQMCTNYIYGGVPYPTAIADIQGTTQVCLKAESPKHVENHFRKACVDMGCCVSLTSEPMKAKDMKNKTVLYSTSRAWRLGQAVLQARKMKSCPVKAVLEFERGKLICTGKIIDVERKTTGGFVKGHMTIEGSGEYKAQMYTIQFQNENLLAEKQKEDGTYEVVACVPDLIVVVDVETAEPIPTDELRYGLRVAIVTLPAPPLLRTPEALSVVGPSAFGYKHVTYTPVGEFLEHSSVLSEYD